MEALMAGDFTQAERTFRAVRELDRRGQGLRAERSQRHGARHRRRGRPARRAHGAAERRGPAGVRLLHEHGIRQGPGTRSPTPRRPSCSTGRACAGRCACAGRWSASPTRRPTPISRAAPRDSRIGAWASQQSRPLESRFALEKAVAFYAAKYAIGEVPRPPALDRLPHQAGLHGVLAGPAVPAARPHRLPPADAGWRLVAAAALPLSGGSRPV